MKALIRSYGRRQTELEWRMHEKMLQAHEEVHRRILAGELGPNCDLGHRFGGFTYGQTMALTKEIDEIKAWTMTEEAQQLKLKEQDALGSDDYLLFDGMSLFRFLNWFKNLAYGVGLGIAASPGLAEADKSEAFEAFLERSGIVGEQRIIPSRPLNKNERNNFVQTIERMQPLKKVESDDDEEDQGEGQASAPLTVGSMVQTHSLQAKPEYNGKTGKILEHHASTGRYSVQLLPASDGLRVTDFTVATVLQVRPENLRLTLKYVKHKVCFVRETILRRLNRIPRRGSDESFRDPVTGLPNDNVHEPMPKFDSSKTCFVFISHRWLRAGSDYTGHAAHPDDLNHQKCKLILSAFTRLRGDSPHTPVAQDFEFAVWIDFSCLDQDKAPGDELNAAMVQIMQVRVRAHVVFVC
jgi:hypothetical protein